MKALSGSTSASTDETMASPALGSAAVEGPGTSRAMTVCTAFGITGVIGLLLLGFFAGSGRGDVEATSTLIVLAISTMAGAVGLVAYRRLGGDGLPVTTVVQTRKSVATGRERLVRLFLSRYGGLLAVGMVTTATAQTWFIGGSSVAGGDLSPPDGTAWIGHLFSPWVWTGSNLGGPGTFQMEAPWAAVLGLVHLLGGSAGTAQRIWCTAAFVGAGAACYGLLRVSGLRAAGSAIGALCYCYNPYVMTSVGPNSLYLVALAMIPIVALVVVATGRRRLSVRSGALLLAGSAPFLGYTFLNPPLTVMVAATLVLTPIVVLFVWGRAAGGRALWTVAIGIPLLVLLCSYWVVPALLSLGGAATSQLSAAPNWTWTESRSGLANAFWLNTTWAWQYPQYFPFAARYAQFPLVVVRYFIPAAAFAALPLTCRPTAKPGRRRMAIAAAAIALFFIVLATGTLWPGKIIFDPLYRLPLGWLLREPGRLLLIAGLAYAVLVGIATDGAVEALRQVHWPKLRSARFRTRPLPPLVARLGLGVAIVTAVAVTAAPLAFGTSIVPAGDTGVFAAAHVTVPQYWTSMANFVNRSKIPGNMLVMPPNDFYQMPYTWGYYGADGFIVDMFGRNVLNPSSQGYWPGQHEVISAVNLLAEAALSHQWNLVDQLLVAIGTQDILLRGDIDASFPGRAIVSPAALRDAFGLDPYLRLEHRDGPLAFYTRALRPIASPKYTTVDSTAPDPADLSILPSDTALVTSPMQRGVSALIEVPVKNWRISDGNGTAAVAERPGWTYAARLVGLGADGASAATDGRPSSGIAVTIMRSTEGNSLLLSFPVTGNDVRNGNFADGPWQANVGDCNNASGPQSLGHLRADTYAHAGPDGSGVLQLSASVDTACESTRLNPSSGRVLVSVKARRIAGNGPRLCLYAIGPNQCVPLPAMRSSAGWSTYRAEATPPSGTTGLALFLYSDAAGNGASSIDQYSNVAVYGVVANPVVVATPTIPQPVPLRLTTSASSFSSTWTGPVGGRHVLVDGIKNGWLVPPGSRVQPFPHYQRGGLVVGAAIASAAVAFGLLCAAGLQLVCRVGRRARRGGGEAH